MQKIKLFQYQEKDRSTFYLELASKIEHLVRKSVIVSITTFYDDLKEEHTAKIFYYD